MFTLGLFVMMLVFLLWSLKKDQKKTIGALKTARGLAKKTLGEMLAIIGLIGLIMALLPEETVAGLLGESAGFFGLMIGAMVGTVTLIPAFIAFPLAGSLQIQGASLPALAAFITTLTMVGVVTAPMEIRFFGKRFTFLRNGLSFIFALLIALLLGVIL